MQKRVSTLVITSLVAGTACSSVRVSSREPAAADTALTVSSQPPALKYITYLKKGPHTESIDVNRWKGISAGGRSDYLLKLYYANTRTVSRSGKRHAACFLGGAEAVKQAFFDSTNSFAGVVQMVSEVKASTDDLMLGLAFIAKNQKNQTQDVFFRIQNCDAGKASIDPAGSFSTSSGPEVQIQESALAPPQTQAGKGKGKAAVIDHKKYGFVETDKVVNPGNLSLPSFKLKADYHRAPANGSDLPWKNLDARNPAQAWELAVLAQRYIYEGMANQSRSRPDFNFIPEKSKRFWCQMPWLNVGPSGREGVHGLTKERDLFSSPTMDLFKNASRGTDWGVAYYNAEGCQALGQLFGTIDNLKDSPDFSALDFANGTFIAKILFTTADFPSIKNAFKWNANVSGVGENERSVRPVRHIQMDIAIKDDGIKGALPQLKNWLMLTYYYDDAYNYEEEYRAATGKESPLKNMNLPEGFLKMRPMGVQTGFGAPSTGDTVLFAGAQANSLAEGRLNGPADNPKSSCLSCHGTAGTKTAMVPGFMSNSEFEKAEKPMDFSMQGAIAKRNIETYIKTTGGEN